MPFLTLMRRSLLLALPLLVLLGWTSMAGAATPRPDTSAVDDLITEYADRHPAHGASVAILTDGDVEHRAWGTDAEGEPVTEDTAFRIASMSKAMTAATVMTLVDAGELDLDAPLTASLPDFAMADPRAEKITVRMLLAHTSGIGGGSARDLGRGGEDGADLLADLRDETLGADPGEQHAYLNLNYALAALAVEQVTGRPFDQVQQDQLFTPLGMAATTATVGCATPVPGLGSGHTVLFGAVVPFPEPADLCLGSGGVVTTAADLARWANFQAGDGRAEDGTRVLSSASLTQLHTPQPGTAATGGYGLGWSFGEADGVSVVEHGGALATWSSHIALATDDAGRPTGTAAIVLTDTVGAPSLLAGALAGSAATGTAAVLPPVPGFSPDRVALGVLLLILASGAVGVWRARTWPSRRRRAAGRVLGLALPAGLAALGVALPMLLASVAFGVRLDLVTAWHMGLAMLPAVALVALALVLVGAAVLAARAWALRAAGTVITAAQPA